MKKNFEFSKKYEAYLIPIEFCIKPEYYDKQSAIPERADSLVKELKHYELVYPITMNDYAGREGVVIDGWKRVEAYRKLGRKMIPATFQAYTLEEEREQHLLLNLRRAEIELQEMIGMLHKLQPQDVGLAVPIIKEFAKGTEAKIPHKVTMALTPAMWQLHERALKDFKRPTGEIYYELLNGLYNENDNAK